MSHAAAVHEQQTDARRGLLAGKRYPCDPRYFADLRRADPGLALATRKGTGYYKVPSLKGLWYRGHYLHDGSVATLEEMFDPDRVKETHTPGGWRLPGTSTHAIKGHDFRLHLEPSDREALIAFLRTL
jgi:RoxA-like, cytochrome c-like